MREPRVFARAFDQADAAAPLRAFILAELSRPERHWHGLLHHALMLRAITSAKAAARRLLTWAVLFHDIVYDATRSDNEEASAEVARHWLTDLEAEPVAALILATKHHDLAAADAVTRMLLEADLAILWTSSRSLYDFYARGIRREYAHVSDSAYRAGRTAVLDRLEGQLRRALPPDRAEQLAVNLAIERAGLAAGVFDLSV